jgi:hypothetical protein
MAQQRQAASGDPNYKLQPGDWLAMATDFANQSPYDLANAIGSFNAQTNANVPEGIPGIAFLMQMFYKGNTPADLVGKIVGDAVPQSVPKGQGGVGSDWFMQQSQKLGVSGDPRSMTKPGATSGFSTDEQSKNSILQALLNDFASGKRTLNDALKEKNHQDLGLTDDEFRRMAIVASEGKSGMTNPLAEKLIQNQSMSGYQWIVNTKQGPSTVSTNDLLSGYMDQVAQGTPTLAPGSGPKESQGQSLSDLFGPGTPGDQSTPKSATQDPKQGTKPNDGKDAQTTGKVEIVFAPNVAAYFDAQTSGNAYKANQLYSGTPSPGQIPTGPGTTPTGSGP